MNRLSASPTASPPPSPHPSPHSARPRGPRRAGSLRALVLVLAVFGGVGLPAVVAAPASAVVIEGFAHGHHDPAAGTFIGSYRLADGQLGFCLDITAGPPSGHETTYVPLAELGWYSAEDAARLAYIARTWAGTTDADTAAAGQLATWMITGLGRHDAATLAGWAGASRDHVLALAHAMLAEASAAASRAVTASIVLDRGADGSDRVRADIGVDRLDTGWSSAPAGAHQGSVTLTGATFADGSTTATIRNGESLPIRPTADTAVWQTEARVEFVDLPYGTGLTVAHTGGGIQSLLVATPASTSAAAAGVADRPSPLPFAPTVRTTTSAPTARTGESVHDILDVGLRTLDGHATEWGVRGPDGGPYLPVRVVVRSRLLGPFDEAPALADVAPDGAPTVCETLTLVDRGPGRYTTDACTLPGPGYYVWVESIDGADSPPEDGPDRVSPWRSAFGIATEITVVAPELPPVPEAPVAPAALAATGAGPGPAPAVALGALGVGLALLLAGVARRRSPRSDGVWRARSDAGSVGKRTIRST